MVDVRTPLDGYSGAPRAMEGGDAGTDTLHVSHAPVGSLVQVAGWGAGFLDDVAPLLGRLGLNALGDFQTAQTGVDCVSFRIAPNRLLIWHKDQMDALNPEPKPDPSTASILDLSHSRVRVTVAGTPARDLMERLSTIDFRPKSFPVGSFAQTTIHHTSSLIFHSNSNSYELLIPSSYARSLWDYIGDCARPLGSSG